MGRTHRLATVLALGALGASACGPGAAGSRPPAAGPPPAAAPGGEHAITVVFANELSAAFRPETLEVGLDGRPLFLRTAAAGLAEQREILVARDLPLPAGDHVLLLRLGLRGHGEGVFSYLKGYTFTVRSSHTFRPKPGLVVTIHAHERPQMPLDQRPAVRFEETLRAER
jgi:hypothetical protein